MNPLQSGTPASAITPQGYRNSTQSGGFQDGYTGSDLLESSSASYTLKIESPQTKLTVTSGGSNQVLGASTTAQSSSTSVVSGGSEISLFLPITLFVVSVLLTYYFFRKYRELALSVDVLDDTITEE